MTSRRRDLDMWARALGARNDEEAIAELRRLQVRMQNIGDRLIHLFNTVPGFGHSTPEVEQIATFVHKSMVALDEAEEIVGDTRAAFEIHERGKS